MNGKALVIVLGLVTILFAAPFIASVQAGKGQEKLDFLLHMYGRTSGPPEKMWTTDDGITHIQGLPWIVTGDFYIEIGDGGSVETIPKECLSYQGALDITVNSKQGWYVGKVRETITIYTDASKTTERGTLDILNSAKTNTGSNSMFDGHGTGEFEAVKIHGTSTGVTTPNPSPPPANFLTLDRVGTVMGWP